MPKRVPNLRRTLCYAASITYPLVNSVETHAVEIPKHGMNYLVRATLTSLGVPARAIKISGPAIQSFLAER
jgi:hypothetical protein